MIYRNRKFTAIFLAALMPALILIGIAGCGEETTTGANDTENPNVKFKDSITIFEFIDQSSVSGMNIFTQITTTAASTDKDCQLSDTNNTGTGFFLRSGDLSFLNLPMPPGYEARFFQVTHDMSKTTFDTLSQITTNIGSALDTLDFTENNTAFWGYWNAAPRDHKGEHPVYCIWLKGRKNAGGTNGKNVYGLIRLHDIIDSTPGTVGGTRVSFDVRINTNGENDFRKTIPTN